MSKSIFLATLVLCIFFNANSNAQNIAGTVLESLQMNSRLLNRPVKYSVYLPADYNSSNRRYPVVYLLHGYTDDETSWIQLGEAHLICDKAIAAGRIPPAIVIMPDAGATWYVNDYLQKNRYEDVFVQELIPFIDSTYRTRKQREYRAICGLSMGGHGALLFSMRYPSLFSACAAFSSAILSNEAMENLPDSFYNKIYAPLYGGMLKGKARITASWLKNSTLELARTLPVDSLKKVRWYFDCGDNDFLYEGNSLMHITLRKREIPHQFHMRTGTHEWIYWRTGLEPALAFLGESFNN